MAEILATMVVGPLLSIVKDKASSVLLDQYKVMEGMEEQRKVLKRKLLAILDVIADAEVQAAKHREGAKAWLEEVRTVAYRANDVFDEFKYEALRRKAKKEGHYRKFGMDVIKLFPSYNRIVFPYRMGNKLRFILRDMEVLIAEMNAFGFKFQEQQRPSMKWRQTNCEIVDPMKIASESRAQDKKKVVDTLLGHENSEDLTVLPIFGMGGLGKTTLAQLVCNDSEIQKHFDWVPWVCVSDNFDVDFLAKRIVEEAPSSKKDEKETHSSKKDEKEAHSSQKDEKSPLDSLREVVSGKRYLLVLDDVWNRNASQWEKLKSSLLHETMGSCVLTTTRDEAVCQLMRTTETYKPKLLDQSIIAQIIEAKACSSKGVYPIKKWNKIIDGLAKRCAGSPLAATALGSLLHTKPSLEEWEEVLRRTTICDEETGILPILKLSYNDLSPQMRQCFSFCAMFPKDYEIERDMLIQLWMANGFILKERRGNEIFNELLSRSFFLDKKEIPFESNYRDASSKYGYCSRITCKIHDLMHDVAQSAMGNECATVTEPSEREDVPYSTRHLFVPSNFQQTILNGFLEKSSQTLQTLLYSTSHEELHNLSKYKSMRALRSREHSSLKPEYLCHLRYLDISYSDIEALPEDISILYHLQTLNLSNCRRLAQLPKEMKYMTSLCHLYTHGCPELKMMPAELGCLTSLQTLSSFVAGATNSSCSNLGELGSLDIGGYLHIHKLENVTETDAQAANLESKKRLTELEFSWADPEREPQHHHELRHELRFSAEECCSLRRGPRLRDSPLAVTMASAIDRRGSRSHHQKVLEGLKPHDGIKALKIHHYGGSTCPAWMNNLQHVVELVFNNCHKINMLPPLWQLPALQILRMSQMKNLKCLWGGGVPPFTFKKLKLLDLNEMPNLERWWDITKVQGQDDLIFPEVEKLSIKHCQMLSSLPGGSCRVVNTAWRSEFPKLKELILLCLPAFYRWEVMEGTLGEQMTTFFGLEKLKIERCPKLTTLPEAPKLNELSIIRCSQQIWVHAARYITSLSILRLQIDEGEETQPADQSFIKLVDDKEKSSLKSLDLNSCNFLLPPLTAPALWNCFVHLESLEIGQCDVLDHWLENVFRCLVSLKRLWLENCKNLTGRTQQEEASSEQSTATSSTVLPPRLEFLSLKCCASLEGVPTLPTSLRKLVIQECDKLDSIIVRKQQDTRLGGVRDGVEIRQEKSAPLRQGSCSLSPSVTLELLFIIVCENLQSLSVQLDCTQLKIWGCHSLNSLDIRRQEKSAPHQGPCSEATDVPHLSSSSLSPSRPLQHLPSLEILFLWDCYSLESIPDVPQLYSSLRFLQINSCPLLKVFPPFLMQRRLSNKNEETRLDEDHLPSLETLILVGCNLDSLTDMPQVYSSLTYLEIKSCPHLKVLPPCLKQRLNDIEDKFLDARYTGPKLSKPSTWKYAVSGHC